MVKYCTNCGTPAEDIANFCQKCGTKFTTLNIEENNLNNENLSSNDKYNDLCEKIWFCAEEFKKLSDEYTSGLQNSREIKSNCTYQMDYLSSEEEIEKLNNNIAQANINEMVVVKKCSPLFYENRKNYLNVFSELFDLYQDSNLNPLQKKDISNSFINFQNQTNNYIRLKTTIQNYLKALKNIPYSNDDFNKINSDLCLAYEERLENMDKILDLMDEIENKYKKIFI